MPSDLRLTRSLLARALLVIGVGVVAYPLFQAQSKEQTVLLDLGNSQDVVRSLRIDWQQIKDPDVAGSIERNFSSPPCRPRGTCELSEHLHAPNAVYTLHVQIVRERSGGAAYIETTTHEGVELNGHAAKLFLTDS